MVWDKRSGEPPTTFTPMLANFSTMRGDRSISFHQPVIATSYLARGSSRRQQSIPDVDLDAVYPLFEQCGNCGCCCDSLLVRHPQQSDFAFARQQQTIKEIEFLADPTIGEVRIGCPEAVAVLLPPVIQSLSLRYPGIVVHTIDVSAPTLDLPQVRDRSIDLAIVRAAAPPSRLLVPDDLDVEFLLNDETVVVAGQNSPWARRRKINIAELAAERWILPPPQTLNSMVVMDAFQEAGAEQPTVSLVTFSIQLRINLAADGSCITVLPRSMLRLYGSRLPVKVLPVGLPDREWPVVMVTLKNRTPNPIAKLFKEQLRHNFKSV
jgi:DNA-binding transcriptional LysR family regulator